MLSVTQNNHQHKPLMVQAPVRALDPDGVAVVSAGTFAFAIGAGVCWWQAAALEASGRLWYLGVAIAGTVIGLLGLAFGLFRRSLRRRRGSDDDDAATGAPVVTEGPEPEGETSAPPRRAQRSVEESLVDADGVPDRE